MSKTKDFIVTINESRFGTPRENLILDLYESGVYISDGTIIGTPVISDGSIVKGIPQVSVGDYKFSSIDFGKKYTVVISGLGVTTQIPDKLKDIDIGLPYNVTGSDIPYKNNSNISIQSAFENLDATSQLPRIISLESDVSDLESDVSDLESDVSDLQSDTTNIYEIISSIDTTSALEPRVELLETDSTSIKLDVSDLESDVSDLQSDTTNIHLNVDNISDYLYNFNSEKVLVSNVDGTIITSIITVNELESLDNITGNIQNQIDNIPDINVFDPNDGSVGQILSIASDGTNNILVPIDVSNSSSGVNYLFIRGKLSQENTVESGKAFFGSISVDVDSGSLVSSSVANYGGDNITISTNISRALSSKISTGIFKLQCRTNGVNSFAGTLSNDYNKFEHMYKPVYGKRRIEYDEDSETYLDLTDGTLVGHCILDMRYSYENFYFQTAQLIIKTFDTNWNLADNIIETGVVIEIKAFDV